MTDKKTWEAFFDAHAPVYEENVFTKNTAIFAPVMSLISFADPIWSQCPWVMTTNWTSFGFIETISNPCANCFPLYGSDKA